MANGLQFIDGQLQFVGQGTDPFFDESVPGAAQSNPQLDVTPQVNQQIIDEEQRSIEQAQTEQTEAQRLQAEQRKKEVRAEKAKLAEQKAALDAREAADEAGFTPANQQVLREGLGTPPEPEPDIPNPVDSMAPIPEPQGAELIDQGFEQRREGAAAEAGAEAGRLKEEAKNLELAAVEAQKSFNVQRDAAAAMRREQNRLADIDAAHQAEIETDVQRPSPSMFGLVGVFLNGLIAPMQGGRNTALEIVNRQLANEVDLELANKKQRIAGLEKQRGIALDKAELARGEAVQRELMHAKKLKAFREQLQGAVDSKFLPAQRKAQLQSLLGELDVQQGQHQQNASAKAAELAMRREQMELRKAQAVAKAAGRGGKRAGTKPGQARVNTLLKNAGLDPKKATNRELIGNVQVTGPDGTSFGFVGTQPSVMKAFNKKAAASERALDEMAELAKLLQQDGIAIDTPLGKTEQAARIQSRYGKLLVGLKNQFELGAISGSDAELMQQVLGRDPTDWKNLTPDAALASLEELYNASVEDMRAAVRSSSLGQAEYAPRLSWQSLTKPIGKGRRRTNTELNLQLDTIASEAKTATTPEEKAGAANELVGTVDSFLSDGISAANIDEAKRMRSTLDRIPKDQRRLPLENQSEDRLQKLQVAIKNWETKTGGKKGLQKKQQTQSKKARKRSVEQQRKLDAIKAAAKKASLKR